MGAHLTLFAVQLGWRSRQEDAMLNSVSDASSCSFEVGSVVIVERRGRPWRMASVQLVTSDIVRLVPSGIYSASTGWRLDSVHEKQERLVAVTPERVDYLLVVSFKKAVTDLDVTKLDGAQIQQLAELARQFGRIQQRADSHSTSLD